VAVYKVEENKAQLLDGREIFLAPETEVIPDEGDADEDQAPSPPCRQERLFRSSLLVTGRSGISYDPGQDRRMSPILPPIFNGEADSPAASGAR
jgi:hypothetical protein